jgi:DNA invertase Pin-like site-specific DNA recombinase
MRNFKPVEDQEEKKPSFGDYHQTVYRTDKKAVAYGRQSNKKQVIEYKESGIAQTKGLVKLALQRGWNEENIILLVENVDKDGKIRGISGKLRIDQRRCLKETMEMIEANEVGAVFATYEDRLFRDETRIQVATFIEACREHNVIVFTNHMPFGYNFKNKGDRDLFYLYCEHAAAFDDEYNKRMAALKEHVSKRGEYDGRGLPIGYMVDYRKTIIEDGKEIPNPTYKKYIPYEPHAKVIRFIFRRFRELGGSLSKLCREIRTMEVVFPPCDKDIVDERSIKKYGSLKVEGGYRPTKQGIISILTNPVYIGCWVYHSVVIHEQNHSAIVARDDFDYAFRRLNRTLLNGNPNPEKKHGSRHAREVTPMNAALLPDVITGKQSSVYIIGNQRGVNYYGTTLRDKRYGVIYNSAYPVHELDALVTEKLLEHLAEETQFTEYRSYAEEAKKRIEQSSVVLKRQLREAEKEIAGLEETLKLPPEDLDFESRRRFSRQLALAKKTHEEVQQELKRVQAADGSAQLLEYHELIAELPTYWPDLPMEDKKRLIVAFIQEVKLRAIATHWFAVSILWKNPTWGKDTALIWRSNGSSPNWTEAENDILKEHFATADRKTLLELLPRRNYRAIYYQATSALQLPKRSIPNNTPLHREVSMRDFRFMQRMGVQYTPEWGSKKILWSGRW